MPLQLKKKDNPDYISMGYQDSTMYLGKKILLNPAFCQVTVFLNLYSEVRKTEKQLLFFFILLFDQKLLHLQMVNKYILVSKLPERCQFCTFILAHDTAFW